MNEADLQKVFQLLDGTLPEAQWREAQTLLETNPSLQRWARFHQALQKDISPPAQAIQTPAEPMPAVDTQTPLIEI